MKKYYTTALLMVLLGTVQAQTWTQLPNTPDTASYESSRFYAHGKGDTILIATQRTVGLGFGYYNYWSDDALATIHEYTAAQLPERPINEIYPQPMKNIILGNDFNGRTTKYTGNGNWEIFDNTTSSAGHVYAELDASTMLMRGYGGGSTLYFTAPLAAEYSATSTGITAPGFHSFIQLSSPNRLILGTESLGFKIIDAGNVSGMYDATLSTPVGSSSAYVQKIERSASGVLYALFYGARIYTSNDNGLNWSPLSTSFTPSASGSYYKDITLMGDGSLLIIASNEKVYRSTDGGATASLFTTGIPSAGVFVSYDQFIKLGDGSIVINVNALNSTSFATDTTLSGLYKMGAITGLTEVEEITSTNVYPNPAGNTLTIEPATSQNISYTILDGMGRLVSSGKIQGKTTIDISAYTPGLYLVKTGNAQPMKLIKQ